MNQIATQSERGEGERGNPPIPVLDTREMMYADTSRGARTNVEREFA